MGTNYTINELIVSRAAKELRDNELVVIGQGIAMAAGVLARKTHAPNSVILTEAGMFGIDPFKVRCISLIRPAAGALSIRAI